MQLLLTSANAVLFLLLLFSKTVKISGKRRRPQASMKTIEYT